MSRSIEQQVIGTLLDQTKNSREEENTKNQEKKQDTKTYDSIMMHIHPSTNSY
jgi:hypothetical protein